jgi:hypothetical protein
MPNISAFIAGLGRQCLAGLEVLKGPHHFTTRQLSPQGYYRLLCSSDFSSSVLAEKFD